MSLANVTVDAASAVSPNAENGQRNRAEAAANAASAKPNRVHPIPTPTPLAAINQGFGKSIMASSRPDNPYFGVWAGLPIAFRSAPALKALPAPVKTNTLVLASAAAPINASASASINSLLNAFKASGLFNVTIRMP